MATKHVMKIKKSEDNRPGALASKARKRASYILFTLIGMSILAGGLMLAGIGAPGTAWVYNP